MVAKLKLQLKPGEVVALSKHLALELSRCDVKALQKNPADMMIMSAIYELYVKVKEKAENIRLFGSRRGDELHSLTISRTQALALCCLEFEVPDTANALQSYESNFLQVLVSKIYQTFLI